MPGATVAEHGFAIYACPPLPSAENLPVPVSAPRANPLVVTGRKSSIEATTPELVAFAGAQQAHAIFDRNTGRYGYTDRNWVARWGHRWLRPAVLVGSVAALAGMMGGIADTAFHNAITGALCYLGAVAVPATAAAVFTYGALHGLQLLRWQEALLPEQSVAPLRAAFDAEDAAPLQKAVIAELAYHYLDDLDRRQVRGDGARAVLLDITKRAGELDADTRSAARHLAACFCVVHDDTGALRRDKMRETDSWLLEQKLAKVPPAMLPEVRAMLLAVLFDGGTARLKQNPADRAHLFRILTGLAPPTAGPCPGEYWQARSYEQWVERTEAKQDERRAARIGEEH